MESEDYRKDGILYCGTCNQPKEVRYEVFGRVSVTPCLCACEQSAHEKTHNEFLEMQNMIRISDMRIESIRDKERRRCRFEDAEETSSIEKCRKYVANFEEMRERNIGLLMWGNVGNGKSFAAACIANALNDKGIPAMMTSFPAILDDSSNTMDIARQMGRYDLVILDDLGAERQSQYALEKVFYVIDERYKSGKPLIVTTNQRLTVIENYAENGEADYKRIYDRVLEMCVPIAFKEPSRRKAIRHDKEQRTREMLLRGMA